MVIIIIIIGIIIRITILATRNDIQISTIRRVQDSLECVLKSDSNSPILKKITNLQERSSYMNTLYDRKQNII